MKNEEFVIIVPSYNEVKNVAILIKKIDRDFPNTKIFIVDDSNLNENKKLKKIISRRRNITLISRLKKLGRGSAVFDGFKEAIKNKNIKFIFEMDSDLAHDPKEMSRFIKKINSEEFDLIIGSRYLPGGRIMNIAPNRTIASRLINKFLYYWLGIGLSDHTSGFRLYNRRAIEFLLNRGIKSKGFITLSETAYILYLGNFKIGEVPITWNYRKYGKSNVNTMELIRSLVFVIKLRFAK